MCAVCPNRSRRVASNHSLSAARPARSAPTCTSGAKHDTRWSSDRASMASAYFAASPRMASVDSRRSSRSSVVSGCSRSEGSMSLCSSRAPGGAAPGRAVFRLSCEEDRVGAARFSRRTHGNQRHRPLGHGRLSASGASRDPRCACARPTPASTGSTRATMGPGFWAVTRLEHLQGDQPPARRCSRPTPGGTQMQEPEPDSAVDAFQRDNLMLSMDPPQHTRYRKLVNRGFTPRMIGLLEDYLENRTRDDRRRGLRDGPGRLRHRHRRPSCRCRPSPR